MNDTINHYLCTSTTPPNPEYWKNRDDDTWLFRVFPDRVEASTNRDDWLIIVTRPEWFTSTANTVYIRCDEHGNPLQPMPADAGKHHGTPPASVAQTEEIIESPLKVGDWVETQNLEFAEYHVRQTLARLTWPRQITRITAVNLTVEGLDSYVAQLFFRRVPPPSEQAERAERTPEQDRVAELERERDELKSQLSQTTRERDEYYDDLLASRQKIVTLEERNTDKPVVTLRVPASERTKELESLREKLTTAEADRQYVCDTLGITKKYYGWQLEPADPVYETFREAVDALSDQISELDGQAQDRAQAVGKLQAVQAEAAAMRRLFRASLDHAEGWRSAGDGVMCRTGDRLPSDECLASICVPLKVVREIVNGTAGRDLLDELADLREHCKSLRNDARDLSNLEPWTRQRPLTKPDECFKHGSPAWKVAIIFESERASNAKLRQRKNDLLDNLRRKDEQLSEQAPLVAIARELRELLTDVDPLDAVADMRIVVKEEEDGEKLMGLLKKLRDEKGGE